MVADTTALKYGLRYHGIFNTTLFRFSLVSHDKITFGAKVLENTKKEIALKHVT